MKNVLLVSLAQRPFHSPARTIAAQRTYGYAKYLPSLGWRPVVLCCDHALEGTRSVPSASEVRRLLAEHPDDAVVIRTGSDRDPDLLHRAYGRAFRAQDGAARPIATALRRGLGLYAMATVPVESREWLAQPLAALDQVVAAASIDACVASIFPDSSARVAARLRERHGVPWLADFRDPIKVMGHPIAKRIATRTIGQVVASASAVASVSRPLADDLAAAFHRDVDVITNGYFEEEYADLEPIVGEGDRVSILYTGTIYGPRIRSLQMFLSGLAEARRRDPDRGSQVVFRYFGTDGELVRREAVAAGVESCVEIGGMVDRTTALRHQVGADVLLLITWDDPSIRGCYSGKIFEYLRAMRPMLVVPGDRDVVDELVERARAGVSTPSAAQVADRLLSWVDEKRGSGEVRSETREGVLAQYSRRTAATHLASILDRIAR